MKRFLFGLFLFGFLLFPFIGFAGCDKDGTTVIFINGIFGDLSSAVADKESLKDKFLSFYDDKDVKFINGFNPSHIGKAGDLIKAVMQAYGNQDLDFDLTTILNQVHSQIETRKILLVGHSQGTFYTNLAYEYLVKNGVPPQSIAVYNIATPADYVAGNGKYITSSTDKVIESIVRELAEIGSAKTPLESNITIELSEKEQADPFGGHSFSQVYLDAVPGRIIGDIYSSLQNLSAANQNNLDECFIKPGEGLAYKMQKLGLGFLDSGFKTASSLDATDFVTTSEETLAKVFNWGRGVVSYIAQVFKNGGLFQAALGKLQKTEESNGQEDEPFFYEQNSNNLNTSTQEGKEGFEDFTGTGGPDPDLIFKTELDDLLDEIEEKLDIINGQIMELQKQNFEADQEENNQEAEENEEEEQEEGGEENTTQEENTDTDSQDNTNTTGGGVLISYPKILISEVQVSGVSDSKEEFVELYNPNSEIIDLTGWYLQRKTKTSSGYLTYASKNLFLGKQIMAKSYFLISRCGYFETLSDICVENAISDDNSFVLKNPSGDVSDKLGIGDAQEYESLPAQNPLQDKNQTIGRKLSADGSEQESDNNFMDFELQNPTPKAKNTVFTETIIPKEPELKKILINEIQISGTEDKKAEFVELYNPNDEDIDLTGWYLQRKTASSENYSTYAPATLFEEKIIRAKSYFLISREEYFTDKADIFVTNPLTEDNTLVLKRPDKSISDKVGWQNATDFETTPACSFDGGQSIERKIIGIDTDNNFDDFRVSDAPSPRESFIKSKIEDKTDYENSFKCDNGVCLYELSLSWNSTLPDIDFFRLQYKLNNGDWQDWFLETRETSASFNGFYSLIEEENVYSFRVKAQDIYKNESDWREISIDLSVPVVINEVALFGTIAGNNDNWIELYNRSKNDVDLTGWQITFEGGSALLSGEIPAKGFYILENGDDNVLDTPADNIFEGFFSEKSLYLKDSKNRRVDEVYDNGDWNYGNMEQNHFSLERISPYSFGFVKENWKLNDSKKMNGKDRDGNSVYGTPGNENSYYQLYTVLPTGFGRDIVLPKNLSPYAFFENTKVFDGIKLTISEGTVLKAINPLGKIIVEGTLRAIGSPEEKIVFTSIFDDEFGGDTNNDLSETIPGPGNWFGIEFAKKSVNSEMDNVILRYGGSSLIDFGTVVKINQASVKIKNSIFENNLNRGLFLVNSSSEIESNQFLNIQESSQDTGFNAVGISVLGGTDIIRDCYFKENNYGITVENWNDGNGGVFDSRVLIQNNNFEKNKKPIYVWTLNGPVFLGNKATENDYNAIVFFKHSMINDLILGPDLPYLADGMFFIPENTTLTLDPGVVMNLSGMNIEGTLKAIGTQESPVIFRDYYWDQEWAQKPGKWHGLRFTETSKDSEIENVEISFAGDNSLEGREFEAAIRAENCNISLKNSSLRDNQNNGLYLINADAVIDAVVFKNHTEVGYPGASANAIHIKGGKTETKNSYFENQTFGIYLEKWTDSDGNEIIPDANLHTESDDPEKNIFVNIITPGGDIFDATLP
jgi:hypothetical protein